MSNTCFSALRTIFARHNHWRSDVGPLALSAIAAAAAAVTALTAAHDEADARSARSRSATASEYDLQSRASSFDGRCRDDATPPSSSTTSPTRTTAATDVRAGIRIERKRLFRQVRHSPLDVALNNDKADDQKEDDALSKSIVLLTNVLSLSECQLLRTEADRILDAGLYGRDLLVDEAADDDDHDDGDDADDEGALRRVSLCDATTKARRLSNDVLFRRVLPALRRDAPDVIDRLGLSEYDDDSVAKRAKPKQAIVDRFDWAADEPSINRYTTGGKFDPHKDGYALTVLVTLSENGAFEGGGTRFFESSEDANKYVDAGDDGAVTAAVEGHQQQEEEGEAAVGAVRDNQQTEQESVDNDNNTRISSRNGSVLVKPPLGSALLFGGDTLHAGCPVTSGVRHVYVASFSLKEDKNADAIMC